MRGRKYKCRFPGCAFTGDNPQKVGAHRRRAHTGASVGLPLTAGRPPKRKAPNFCPNCGESLK